MQTLNRQDESFLDTETPTAPSHVGGLEIYRLPRGAGRDYMQKLFKYLKAQPVRAEPFNFKLVTVEPPEESQTDWLKLPTQRRRKPKPQRGWETLTDVDTADHVFLHALPRPGGQRELGELVSRLHVARLDRSRPLWEVHLIEGLEGGRYAMYTKLHHSQFDGKRGMDLIRYIRSSKASARNLPPLWAVKPPASEAGAGGPAASESTLRKIVDWGKALRAMSSVRQNVPGDGVIAPYSAPESILNQPLTERRRLGTVSLPIDRLKALGAAIEGGATINEVFLAICGGALRRYLAELKALPDKPLIAACPVAVARKDDTTAGNAVAQILVSLGTNIANPKKRLLAVVESSRVNKGQMKELGTEAYGIYTELSMIPQMLAAKTSFGHRVLNANLIISNMPGPRERQYVNGAELESMYAASLLLAGQALNITASSYHDSLDVGIIACPEVCPGPQKIAVYAGEELAVLERAMQVGAKQAAGKTTKRAATKRAAKKPPARKTAAKKPAATKPAAKKPAATKPAATKPAATKPAAKKPAARKPAAEKPVAKKTAAKKTGARKAPAAAAPASVAASAPDQAVATQPAKKVSARRAAGQG